MRGDYLVFDPVHQGIVTDGQVVVLDPNVNLPGDQPATGYVGRGRLLISSDAGGIGCSGVGVTTTEAGCVVEQAQITNADAAIRRMFGSRIENGL